MKKGAGTLFAAVCIATILAVCTFGTAFAAIIPVSGVEDTWLHHGDDGQPIADWKKRISDLAPVRAGDQVQFENRWFNSYEGSADIRISFGGDTPATVKGGDETVYYGLNYGNYYPSDTGSWPAYALITEANTTPYGIMVTHQYVYNGVYYGTLIPEDHTLLFQWRAAENPPGTDSGTAPAPTATVKPTATPRATPATTPTQSSPGFDFGMIIALASVLMVAQALYGVRMKR